MTYFTLQGFERDSHRITLDCRNLIDEKSDHLPSNIYTTVVLRNGMVYGSKKQGSGNGINRRRVLQTLGGAASVSLAGCSGNGNENGNGDSQEMGERVPEVKLDYFSNWGGRTQVLESMMPIIQDNIEQLGVNTSLTPKEISRILENWISDQREQHFSGGFFFPGLDRIDPKVFVRRQSIDWAGDNGKANLWNYASCEYSEYAIGQVTAPNEERRRELITEALRVTSEDAPLIPISSYAIFSATNIQEININGAGDAGMTVLNPSWLIKSRPKNRDIIRETVPPNTIRTPNHPTSESTQVLGLWNQLIHTPLFQYNENYEFEPGLARDYEFSNEGRRLEIELFEGGTFHNGDPITTEHVKFTYEMLTENSDFYPRAGDLGLTDEGIQVEDDHTIVFNFEEPSLPVLRRTFATWGIFHKQSWQDAGVMENPEEAVIDPIIGSGPFKVENYQPGQFLETEAHDGHPKYDVDHGVGFRGYGNEQTAIQAFREGEVDSTDNLSPGGFGEFQDMDGVRAMAAETFTPWTLQVQCNHGPTQFTAFRRACAAVINRREIVDVALYGQVEPQLYATTYSTSSEWMSDTDKFTKMTESETGSIDEARSILEDAGWGWDDDENLHYPPDVNTNPLWPQGETPSPDDFPCLNSQGEFVSQES